MYLPSLNHCSSVVPLRPRKSFHLHSRYVPSLIAANPDPEPQTITPMRSAKAVVSEKLARFGQPASIMSHTTMAAQRPPAHTLTSLKRWSVVNKELPCGYFRRRCQVSLARALVDFLQPSRRFERSMFTTSTILVSLVSNAATNSISYITQCS